MDEEELRKRRRTHPEDDAGTKNEPREQDRIPDPDEDDFLYDDPLRTFFLTEVPSGMPTPSSTPSISTASTPHPSHMPTPAASRAPSRASTPAESHAPSPPCAPQRDLRGSTPTTGGSARPQSRFSAYGELPAAGEPKTYAPLIGGRPTQATASDLRGALLRGGCPAGGTHEA